MNKLLRTTYRKVYKLSSSVDKSVALRAMLVCAPLTAFDHHTDAWVPLNWPGMIATPESDLMLDCIIRQLNNGRQYYIPRGAAEEDMVSTTSEAHAAHTSANSATDPMRQHTADTATGVTTATGHRESRSDTDSHDRVDASISSSSHHTSASTDDATTTAATRDNRSRNRDDAARTTTTTAKAQEMNSGSGGSTPSPLDTTTSLLICTGVRPYSSLCRTARSLFETMSFSINNLNIAFAAIKLLHQLYSNNRNNSSSNNNSHTSHRGTTGDADSPTRYEHDMSFDTALCVPARLRRLPAPQLTRVLQPARFEGFALLRSPAEMLRSLARSDAAREEADRSTVIVEEGGSGSSATPTTTPSSRPNKSTMIWVERRAASPDSDDGDGASTATPPPMHAAARVEETTAATSSSSSSPSTRPSARVGVAAQFLLAHPMLTGFFAHTVQLLIRHSDDDAAALVLNKPLLNDKGVCMTVGSTVHLNRVHPIFRTFLSQHPVMIAGPVMRGGSFDDSLFLLHRIPDISGATLVGPQLWIDGDLDVLYDRLARATVAEVEQSVVVLCGMACWSRNQLSGEVAGGTWVVARAAEPPQDGAFSTVADYVMQTVGHAAAAATRMVAEQQKDRSRSEHGTLGHTRDEVADALLTRVESDTARDRDSQDKDEQKQEAEEEEEERRRRQRRGAAERNARAALAAASPRAASERALRRAAQVWMWSYDILGEPYAELSQCASSLDEGEMD